MNEADLVVVLATPLYGKSLRAHYGSKEELVLLKKLHKPFFLIKACDQITDPGVRDLEFRQPDCFVWGLPDPGEPQLPGGLVESIIDALNEERGIFADEDEAEDEAARFEAEEAAAKAAKEAAAVRAKGRAGAARAAREAREEALREARRQAAAAEGRMLPGGHQAVGSGGGIDFLKFSPDAMVLRGVCSMIDLIEHDQREHQLQHQRASLSLLSATTSGTAAILPSVAAPPTQSGFGGSGVGVSAVQASPGLQQQQQQQEPQPGEKEGNQEEGEERAGGDGGDAQLKGGAAAAPSVHDELGKEAVAWFRLAAEKHGSRDGMLLLANCLYGAVGASGGERDDEGAIKLLHQAIKPESKDQAKGEEGASADGSGGEGGRKKKKKKKKKTKKEKGENQNEEKKDAGGGGVGGVVGEEGQGEAAAAAGDEAAGSPGQEGVGGPPPRRPPTAPPVLEVGGADGGVLGVRHLEALTNLGECHFHGEGVRKSRPQACKLYRQAAELGFAPAQANLAEMYSKGEGVEEDPATAFAWFAAAAGQGLAEGQYGLGKCYETGDSAPPSGGGGAAGRDKELAAFWYEKAAVQGHRGAAEALDHLEEALMRGGGGAASNAP